MPQNLKTFASSVVLTAVLAISSYTNAAPADERVRTYQLPAQGLEQALRSLATQEKLQIVFSRKDVAGLRTPGVSGDYTAVGVVAELLKDHDLTYSYNGKDMVVIKKKANNGAMIASSDVVRFAEIEAALQAPFDARQLTASLERAEDRLRRDLRADGFDGEVFERTALMRYRGQSLHSLPLPLPAGGIGVEDVADLVRAFEEECARRYGDGAKTVFQTVEIMALRVKATVKFEFPAPVAGGAEGDCARVLTERDVYWPSTLAYASTPIIEGGTLPIDATIVGPALIELPHTTVAVAPGQMLRRDALGNLVLKLK